MDQKDLSLWIKMVQHWLHFSILVFDNGQLLTVDWKIEFITNFWITHYVKSISNFWRIIFIFLTDYFNIQIISTRWIAFYQALHCHIMRVWLILYESYDMSHNGARSHGRFAMGIIWSEFKIHSPSSISRCAFIFKSINYLLSATKCLNSTSRIVHLAW